MAAVSLAILVYIVVVITGTYTTQNISSISNTSNESTIARSLDYVHKSDISIAISSVVGALSSANFLALGSPLVIFFHGL